LNASLALTTLVASILTVSSVFAAEPPAASIPSASTASPTQGFAAPAPSGPASTTPAPSPVSEGPAAQAGDAGGAAAPPEEAMRPKLEFSEIWAYLMEGEEAFLDSSRPITDLGYFGAGLGISGNLVGVPPRAKLPAFEGRVHLVVQEVSNAALTHFCLSPDYPLRDALVADIVAASKDYDGVQIDFEAVSSRDRENFYAFLARLKIGLGEKALSVALPAYVKDPRDGFSYQRVAAIVDRIVVMAYDEHWSSSAPGPVASMDWCRRVSSYAAAKIGPEKLVMGLPFYGRAWADKSLSRAYKYSSLAKIIGDKGIGDIQRRDEIPYIEYAETVNVKVYFDDSASTVARLGLYLGASVRNVAFWRLGQEDSAVWASISVAAAPAPPDQGRIVQPDYSRPPYAQP